MNVYANNIKVFKDTRKLSQTEFKNETKDLKRNTVVMQDPMNIPVPECFTSTGCEIKFTYGGTVSTAYKYAENYDVAALNFADALIPGGLVESGEITQEENICRCSNLYESLILDKCMSGYYKHNKKLLNIYPYYTNALIYSYNTLVFKDDMSYERIEPRYVDIITCPAPCGGDTKKLANLIKERIEGIVKSAIYHQAEVLVLGAWGCGAFGQDAEVMGELFGVVLTKYSKFFKIIDFAIRSNDGEPTLMSTEFERGFRRGYAND